MNDGHWGHVVHQGLQVAMEEVAEGRKVARDDSGTANKQVVHH
jgi:hypothetical protein